MIGTRVRRFALLLAVLLVVAASLGAQEIRVASYNMERLGQGQKDYAALAGVVAHFDLVAALEVMNRRGVQRVMAKLPPDWSALVSRRSEGSKHYREYYAFFYDDRIELVRDLGAYPVRHQFFRPPYGARFRVKATGFEFTLVASHIIYGHSDAQRVAEINNLGKVYRYFERQSGNTDSTIIAGDLNEERLADFSSLIDLGDKEVVPVKGSTIGKRGPDHGYDHLFVAAGLAARVRNADVYYWTDRFPVYMTLAVGSN